MRKKSKIIFGLGVNDADYAVKPVVNGRRVWCIFYRAWYDMLTRCYSNKLHDIRPTYIDCSVINEWLYFSNFKNWMEKQDFKGKHLDKDLLFVGNKAYSPETCVFVDAITNTFTNENASVRGEWPTGVSFNKRDRKFQSHCQNTFTKKRENLGYFSCPNQAHLAWKKRKHEHALQLADLQTDTRVANALRTKYL